MNLWGSSHPLAKVLRESDLTQGLFPAALLTQGAIRFNDDGEERREGFEVVVATLFKPDDVRRDAQRGITSSFSAADTPAAVYRPPEVLALQSGVHIGCRWYVALPHA